MENNLLKDKDWIFALDIGTRNVVGVLGYEDNEELHIVYSHLLEHKTRAMLDGQIHDVQKVTEVIKQLKNNMEQISGIPLKEAAIAAAGRVLKTKTAEGLITFSEDKMILKTHISALELQGVETAKQMLYDENRSSLDYYCVAFSPVKYYLDDYEIDNLEGHKGKKISCSIIATFLPRQVVDSLYTAVEGAGLTVSNLTLEPISAMNLAIPKGIRLLNLALIDIGAGTSDIAITKEGTIWAYGMLPLAGDEFTERLVDEYLIDFNTAETIKKLLSKEETVSFTDILGFNQCISTTHILEKLDDILDRVCREIAQKILALNGDVPPRAIFCVGGGSEFPGITKRLAHNLEMGDDRIVVKNIESVSEQIFLENEDISGPEFITPVGICLTTALERRNNFVNVTVNGEKVKILNTKPLTVMDAAIKASYPSHQLILKNGRSLEYHLNGERKKIQGTLGTQALISINGKEESLKSKIWNNDSIEIESAVHGSDASLSINQIINDIPEKNIVIGDRNLTIKALILVNDEPMEENYQIQNGDYIYIKPIDKLSELIQFLQIKEDEFIFYINESIAPFNTPVNSGDHVQLMIKENIGIKQEDMEREFEVFVNGEKVELSGKKEYLFVHIFNFINFNLHEGKGTINLKLNGKKAAYTDKLNPDDEIEIYWT